MNLFFSELDTLNTPRSTNKLVPLNTNQALGILGRFAEGLLLNETIMIPIKGPALELVVLIRWFGHSGVVRLIEDGAIKFCFVPGTLAYVSEANKQALSLSCDPGILHLVGKDQAWEDINEAVRSALVEQLDYPLGKARRFGRRISRYTRTLPAQDIFEKITTTSYSIAFNLLKEEFKFQEIGDLRKLDNKKDNKVVRKFLDIASANFDLACSSILNCKGVYGNELTWQIIDDAVKKAQGKDAKHKLKIILDFENIPNIPELVLQGLLASEIIKMRTDTDIIKLREWLQNVPDSTDLEIVKSYYNSFKKKSSEKIPIKILRLGIPMMIGLLGPVGKGISMVISTISAFWGDKLISGWSPRIFIEKHFRYTSKNQGDIKPLANSKNKEEK